MTPTGTDRRRGAPPPALLAVTVPDTERGTA